MSGHTPGPWTLDEESRPLEGYRVHAQDPSEYAAEGELVLVAKDLTYADARLIAAAPELLEAAKSVMDEVTARAKKHGETITLSPGLCALSDAIAKAQPSQEQSK